MWGSKPHLSYVSQKTYITPKQYAPQLLNHTRPILLHQLLTLTRRLCLAIPLQEPPQTNPSLLRRQRRPHRVFNKNWTPQFYQPGALPIESKKSRNCFVTLNRRLIEDFFAYFLIVLTVPNYLHTHLLCRRKFAWAPFDHLFHRTPILHSKLYLSDSSVNVRRALFSSSL